MAEPGRNLQFAFLHGGGNETVSTPRYDWWPYVKGMIRRYPELLEKEKELHRISLSKTELTEHYYFDEFLAMMDAYADIHNIDREQVGEVYADELDEE